MIRIKNEETAKELLYMITLSLSKYRECVALMTGISTSEMRFGTTLELRIRSMYKLKEKKEKEHQIFAGRLVLTWTEETIQMNIDSLGQIF